MQQTNGATLHLSQIPLAIAVLLWGGSFYAGCYSVGYALSLLYTNLGMLTAQAGEHPLVQKFGNSADAIRLVTEESHKIMEQQANATAYLTRLQFRMLICGALFYLGWHVLEMALRS